MRTNEEVIKLIKQPKNGNAIQEATKDEEWINAFATGEGSDMLLKNYQSLFVPEMWTTIQDYFSVHTQPLLSPDSGVVYTHFKKVTETSDGQRYIPSFGDDTDLVNFLSNTDSWNFFENEYLSLALYRPNTRMILEMPEEGSMESNPYIALAPITSIHDIEETSKDVDYLIVKDNDLYFYYDKYRYAKYRKLKNSGVIALVSEYEHGFGVTPVRAISSSNKYSSTYVVKKSVVTDSLPDLYAWNLMRNMSKMYRWQNGLPLHFGISSACKERHDTGVHCEGGYFRLPQETEDGKVKYRMARCPECTKKAKAKMTFGKQINVDYQDLMRKPEIANVLKSAFGYVPSDVKLLEFNEENLNQWLRKIEGSIIGKPFNESGSRDAKNLYQVEAESDNQRQTLAAFASDLERAFVWHDSILAYSQYESFQTLEVFMGRGFFVTDERKDIEALKELQENTGDVFLILDKLTDYASNTFQYSDESKHIHKLFLACIPFIDTPTHIFVNNIETFMSISKRDTIIRLNIGNWISEYLATNKATLLNGRRDIVKIRNIKKFLTRKFENYEAEFSESNTSIERSDSEGRGMGRGNDL